MANVLLCARSNYGHECGGLMCWLRLKRKKVRRSCGQNSGGTAANHYLPKVPTCRYVAGQSDTPSCRGKMRALAANSVQLEDDTAVSCPQL